MMAKTGHCEHKWKISNRYHIFMQMYQVLKKWKMLGGEK